MIMDEAAKTLEPEDRISLMLSCKTMATWMVPDRKLMGPLPYMATQGISLFELESRLSPKLADWARTVRTAARARELVRQIRERRAAREAARTRASARMGTRPCERADADEG